MHLGCSGFLSLGGGGGVLLDFVVVPDVFPTGFQQFPKFPICFQQVPNSLPLYPYPLP